MDFCLISYSNPSGKCSAVEEELVLIAVVPYYLLQVLSLVSHWYSLLVNPYQRLGDENKT